MNIKYILILYFLLLFILYLIKPSLFKLDKNKSIYLGALIIIIAIIAFYINILLNYFIFNK